MTQPQHGPIGTPQKYGTVVLLSIVTLGIYWLIWVHRTATEIKAHSGIGDGGVQVVLAIFLTIVTGFLLPNDVQDMRRAAGQAPVVSPLLGLWFLLPIIGWLIWQNQMQTALNDYWVSQGAQPV